MASHSYLCSIQWYRGIDVLLLLRQQLLSSLGMSSQGFEPLKHVTTADIIMFEKASIHLSLLEEQRIEASKEVRLTG